MFRVKVVLVFLAVLMVQISHTAVFAAQDSNATIGFESTALTVAQGELFSLKIVVASPDTPQKVNQLVLNYDKDVVEFVGLRQDCDGCAAGYKDVGPLVGPKDRPHLEDGQMLVVFSRDVPATEFVLVDVYFRALAATSANTAAITFEVGDPSPGVQSGTIFVDENNDAQAFASYGEVALTVENGSAEIDFVTSALTVAQNDLFSVKIAVDSTNIAHHVNQLVFNYDKAFVDFVGFNHQCDGCATDYRDVGPLVGPRETPHLEDGQVLAVFSHSELEEDFILVEAFFRALTPMAANDNAITFEVGDPSPGVQSGTLFIDEDNNAHGYSSYGKLSLTIEEAGSATIDFASSALTVAQDDVFTVNIVVDSTDTAHRVNQLVLNYDKSLVEFVNFDHQCDGCAADYRDVGPFVGPRQTPHLEDGQVLAVFSHEDPVADFILVEAHFRALAPTATNSAAITFEVGDPSPSVQSGTIFTDENNHARAFASYGTFDLTIEDNTSAMINFAPATITAAEGETFSVLVEIESENTEHTVNQLVVNYDTNVVAFVEADHNCAICAASYRDVGPIVGPNDTPHVEEGQLLIVYSRDTAIENFTLVELHFEALTQTTDATDAISFEVGDPSPGVQSGTIFVNDANKAYAFNTYGGMNLTVDSTPQLTIEKAGPTYVFSGESIDYTLTIHNIGSVAVANLVVSDELPIGATYNGGGDAFDGTTITWQIAELAAGQSADVQFSVLADDTVTNDTYTVSADGEMLATGEIAVTTVVDPGQIVVGEYNASPAGSTTVTVDGVDFDNVGAVTFSITYDPAVVTATACEADPNGAFSYAICNLDGDSVRFSLISSPSNSGQFELGLIEFDSVGAINSETALDVAIQTNDVPLVTVDGSLKVGVLGDVTCDGQRNVVDALVILELEVGIRTATTECPLAEGSAYIPLCDVNNDESCDARDALLVLECEVGYGNELCAETNRSVATPAAVSTNGRGSADATIAIEPLQIGYGQRESSRITTTLDQNLQAFTLDIHFDPTVITAVGCSGNDDLLDFWNCNPNFDTGVARLSGIAIDGISGANLELGAIEFESAGAIGDESTLSIAPQTFSSGTTPITNTTQDGTVTVGVPTAVTISGVETAASNTNAAIFLLLIVLLPTSIAMLKMQRDN